MPYHLATRLSQVCLFYSSRGIMAVRNILLGWALIVGMALYTLVIGLAQLARWGHGAVPTAGTLHHSVIESDLFRTRR